MQSHPRREYYKAAFGLGKWLIVLNVLFRRYAPNAI
jgi:hypothetical protein